MLCSIDGCDQGALARSWCAKHYQRWRKHGDPTAILTNNGVPPEQRFWTKVAIGNPDECWPWLASRDGGGYGLFKVNGSNVHASRFAYSITYSKTIPDGLIVMHRCDNPPCVNPLHLVLGTYTDNARDRDTKGRGYTPGPIVPVRGERHPNTSLTTSQVRDIRTRFANGDLRSELAVAFNVGWSTVDRIVKRRVWTHV